MALALSSGDRQSSSERRVAAAEQELALLDTDHADVAQSPCFFEYADADGSSDLDAEELLILTGHVGSDASWAWQERTPSQCLKLEDLLMNSIELRTYLYCVYPALEGLLE